MDRLEADIARWRAFLGQSTAVAEPDVDELEDHLRGQIADLMTAGLSEDEAFLIALKRLGARDELSEEFAREHSGRLWSQLVTTGDRSETLASRGFEMLAFAVGTALTTLLALLAAGYPTELAPWLIRNASFLVMPFLAGYFIRRRGLSTRRALLALLPFAVGVVVVNLYPYRESGATELLVAAHLPVATWFVVAFPYMGGVMRSHERRMDFVRFTGEWFIYYVLIALGGGVLLVLTAVILEPTGVVDVERVVEWALPLGASGAVIVAAWLVESKQRVVENMAPVLTMLFTPLFAVMLVGAIVVYVATGLGDGFDRELVGIFDALLVVVLGLVLYGISARDPESPPGWMDGIQLVAVVSALLLDLIVLVTMVARIGELGFTPNRTAALGLNLLLLINLAGTAWLSMRFLGRRVAFYRLERWQTTYLPLFAVWAAIVVVALPPLFDFT
ncbi:MAG: permease prefix domain 1-containing protein [Acidimicrobiia bacterium]